MPAAKKARTDAGAKVTKLTASWQYKNDEGAWVTYEDEDCELLEEGFQSTKGDGVFVTKDLSFNTKHGTRYTFDFKKMVQLNNDSKKQRDIRRRATDDGPASASAPAAAAAAKVDSSKAAWEWIDDAGLWVAFYDEDNKLIEKAFGANADGQFHTKDLSWNKGFDTPYIFDFPKMTQVNTQSGTVRKIRRGTKAGAWKIEDFGIKAESGAPSAGPSAGPLAFPDYWTPRKSTVDFVPVDLSSKEATDVLKDFHKTIKRSVKIHSLKRVQNYALWQFYAMMRQYVANQPGNEKVQANEKVLFHGCRVRANMDAITEFGFDMRVAASGMYGVGIYFAVNAQYSDNGYVLQNKDKSREMFLCRVTCGSHANGAGSMRRPPPRDSSKPNGQLYDSVTNTGSPTIMHIVFNNTQAYPEYVLHYT
jgi:hypothetical protein